MNYLEWRNNIKKGDKIIKKSSKGEYSVTEVVSISKIGSIKLADGDLIKKKSDISKNNCYIYEYNEVTELEIIKQKKLNKLQFLNRAIIHSKLTIDELDTICSVLDKDVFYIRLILKGNVVGFDDNGNVILDKSNTIPPAKFTLDNAKNIVADLRNSSELCDIMCDGKVVYIPRECNHK